MKFDFEVCFLRFLGFYDVLMKTLALIKKKKLRCPCCSGVLLSPAGDPTSNLLVLFLLLLLRLLLKNQLQSPHGYMLFYALYTQYLIFLRMACLEELRVSWGWCCCYLSLTRTLCVCMFNGLWSNVLFVR
jgi:hypothetical protein